MWRHAPNLKSTHGFSTRNGGVSEQHFDALNLSLRVGDVESHVLENRQRALVALGLVPNRVMLLKQIHSGTVLTVNHASLSDSGLPEADALVTAEADLGLVIETADCYPILLEDAQAGVIGAAHAGWRGTVAGIAARTLEAMIALGAQPERIQAAIGPGICARNYIVGPEVREQFLQAGFPERIVQADDAGRLHTDLETANAWLLEASGVPKTSIWQAGVCSTNPDFFSYRRDQGRTGRMWAVISRRT